MLQSKLVGPPVNPFLHSFSFDVKIRKKVKTLTLVLPVLSVIAISLINGHVCEVGVAFGF